MISDTFVIESFTFVMRLEEIEEIWALGKMYTFSNAVILLNMVIEEFFPLSFSTNKKHPIFMFCLYSA